MVNGKDSSWRAAGRSGQVTKKGLMVGRVRQG